MVWSRQCRFKFWPRLYNFKNKTKQNGKNPSQWRASSSLLSRLVPGSCGPHCWGHGLVSVTNCWPATWPSPPGSCQQGSLGDVLLRIHTAFEECDQWCFPGLLRLFLFFGPLNLWIQMKVGAGGSGLTRDMLLCSWLNQLMDRVMKWTPKRTTSWVSYSPYNCESKLNYDCKC